MLPAIKITNLCKTYAGGVEALRQVDLDIRRGEIFALLGPNGAGKTSLISVICGLCWFDSGAVLVEGHDIQRDYRKTRALIGLVPQEITVEVFEKLISTVRYSRALFGKTPDPAYIEKLLKDLSLWDKRDSKMRTLSGGMKRRAMIAKALAHNPRILFLDEPTAGVDVELRQDMWRMISSLRDEGVTIILTTHYIEEAEEMADRVGVIDKGRLILVEEKSALIRKFGQKQLSLSLSTPMRKIPDSMRKHALRIGQDGCELIYTYSTAAEHNGITSLFADLARAGIGFRDISTSQSSLEDIFVDLTRKSA